MIKVFYHHPLPAVIRGFKIAIVSLPFFFVASFFQSVLSPFAMFAVFAAIAAIFALIIAHDALIYYLDKLIVTSRRIVYVNWITLFLREESEAEFEFIQDIETKEKGILSRFGMFNYGLFKVETASASVSIIFDDANDPDGIKNFIYHLQIKPSKIEKGNLESSVSYDRTRQTENHRNVIGK